MPELEDYAKYTLWTVASLGSIYAGLVLLEYEPLTWVGIASQVSDTWLAILLLAAGGVDIVETLTKIGVMGDE